MSHIIQVIGTILIWWVIIALFLVLNIYLGSFAFSWYRKRKRKKQEAKEQ